MIARIAASMVRRVLQRRDRVSDQLIALARKGIVREIGTAADGSPQYEVTEFGRKMLEAAGYGA